MAEQDSLETDLVAAITLGAVNGRPLQKTGKGGLYENRERLPESLRALARNFCGFGEPSFERDFGMPEERLPDVVTGRWFG